MSERPKKPRIPAFKSYEEEATFWDTHDTTDFEDEFIPTEVRVSRRLSEGLTVRLDPETLRVLRARAREKGLGPTTLIRMWVLERLQEREERSTRART